MKVICRQNCSGKTKELIRESLDNDIPILVFSSTKKKSLEEKSLAYFNQHVKTLFFTDAKDYDGKVLIDDLDENVVTLVKYALNNPQIDVGAVTLSA